MSGYQKMAEGRPWQMKKIKVAGIRQVSNLAQINVHSLPLPKINLAKILAPLSDNSINLEFIVSQEQKGEMATLILGVQRKNIAAALGLLKGMKENLGIEEISSKDGRGMISLFPHGNRAMVVAHFFSALQDAGIKLSALSFSLSAISGLIDEDLLADSLKALSEYFELPG